MALNFFSQRFQRFFGWVWKQEGTPAERARGIAVGVFSGCFPFLGLQTLLGLILASIFRGNRLLAVLGTWISNPVTYFPLYWFNYKIGSLVLGEGESLKNINQLSNQELWEQGWLFSSRLLVGSTMVGVCFGSLIGFICYALIQLYYEQKRFT